ncbi:hypothetical protein Moror_15838, partial [Moniliophthora roreri MCA 2997]
MSERWDRRFHADADKQNLENFQLLAPGPVPYSGYQFYHLRPAYPDPMDSAGPTNSYSSNRVDEGHPNVIGNVVDFPRTGFSNGQLAPTPNIAHGRSVLASPRCATSYGYMGSSEVRSHDYVNAATGLSFPESNHQSLQTVAHSRESPSAASAAGSLHIPPGTGWEIFDSACRFGANYPLSVTTDSAKSVPDPNEKPRVFKQVVATSGVVDA